MIHDHVLDDPPAASFSPARQSDAHFAQATIPRNHIANGWTLIEFFLEPINLVPAIQLSSGLGEGGRFQEDMPESFTAPHHLMVLYTDL